MKSLSFIQMESTTGGVDDVTAFCWAVGAARLGGLGHAFVSAFCLGWSMGGPAFEKR